MNEETESQTDRVVHNLEMLNERAEKQSSVWHVFRNGIIYGVGFVAGSTVLTAIVISITLQFFGNTIFGDVIAWIVAHVD